MPALRALKLPVSTLAVAVFAATQLVPSADATTARSGVVKSHAQAQAVADNRPNFIVITTDDQAAYDYDYMPLTQQWLGGHGYTFPNAISPHPICCPARAELVTGQYGQNSGVQHNKGPRGGYKSLQGKDNTIGTWLNQAGYQTAMVGKYLNQYNRRSGIPKGWDHFNAFVSGSSTYTNTTFANDGRPVHKTEHVDKVITSFAQDYLTEFTRKDAPIFMWVAYNSPHYSSNRHHDRRLAYPVAEDRGTMRNKRFPVLDKPSFNEGDVSDQLPPSRGKGKVGAKDMTERFHSRIEGLQLIDRSVVALLRQLENVGELDNTYVIFTSDNGYLLGEHRLVKKNYLYHEALSVPWVVRVPGVNQARVSQVPVTTVDIAATISDLAGVTPGRTQDGQSFAPILLGGGTNWRDTQLIQTGKADPSSGSWRMRGVRTDRYTYGREQGSGAELLFDHQTDPFEINNVARSDRYRDVLAELRRRTQELMTCVGVGCAPNYGPVPGPN